MGVIVGIITIILITSLGYKFIYKISPREFITEKTRFIYANEGLNEKEVEKLLPLIPEEQREELEKSIKNMEYISKIYIFSNKEFYEISENNLVCVVDTGFLYPLALFELKKYFSYQRNGIYKMNEAAKEKYIGEFKEDLYLTHHRGVFIISINPVELQEFVKSQKEYIFDKEIENYIDENRDDLFGTFIYNNKGNDFYGIEYVKGTGTLNGEKVTFKQEIVLNNEESKKFKPYQKEKKLAEYIEKNDVYLSLNDFSRIEDIIFSTSIFGIKMDSKSFINICKGMFDIDLNKVLKEIDGEAIIRLENSNVSALVKMKDNFSESKKLLSFENNQNNLLNFKLSANIKEKNIIVIGKDEFNKQIKTYNLPKGTFLFADIKLENRNYIPKMELDVLGIKNKIDVKIETTVDELKKLEKYGRRY